MADDSTRNRPDPTSSGTLSFDIPLRVTVSLGDAGVAAGAAEAPAAPGAVRRRTVEEASVVEEVAAGEPVPGPLDRIEADRRALRSKVERDLERRMDDYFGAIGERRAEEGVAGRELRVIAEGDSWFDYPWFLLRKGGVIPRLQARLEKHLAGGSILNLAHHGDEVRQMLGVSQRKQLVRALHKADFDVILFSGGGNDIVGDQLALWLRERSQVAGPTEALRTDVFDDVLGIVKRGYADLVELRDKHAPRAVIFVHAYAVPFPQDKGVCGLGPWLYPALELRGWHEPAEQRAVADTMLRRFGSDLRAWAQQQRDVVYVDTLALNIPREDWHNEIHPDSEGFNTVAACFEQAVRARFPDLQQPA